MATVLVELERHERHPEAGKGALSYATQLLSTSQPIRAPRWRYVISRALLHGKRRAEEMREVARTVQEAGVEPMLSRSIAARQDWAYEQGRRLSPDQLAAPDLGVLLDELSASMRRNGSPDCRFASQLDA